MMDKYAIANEYCHECSARMQIAHPYPDHWIQKGGKPSDARICQSCHETLKNMPVGSKIRVHHLVWLAFTAFTVLLIVFDYLFPLWQIFGRR